jgi:hypothetical protein
LGKDLGEGSYKFEVHIYLLITSQLIKSICSDRCLRAGITCEPDPMCPCKCCHWNKQGCSLMPVNRNTGKTDQHNLMEADIFHFHVSQLENLKMQQAHGHKNPEALGSKTSPLTVLSAIDLESWSSHSPPAAPNSPVAATATALPDSSSHTLPSLTALVAGDFFLCPHQSYCTACSQLLH